MRNCNLLSLKGAGIFLLASMAGFAQAQHSGDVFVFNNAGKLATGSSEEGEPPELFVNVFGVELGEDPAFPYSTDEPGFDTLTGGFTGVPLIGFEFRRTLAKWNGTSFVDVANTMTAEYAVGPSSLTATSGNGRTAGFNLPVNASGEWHYHIDWTLNGLGSATPDTGVYRLAIGLKTPTGVLAASDEIWLIINNGADEAIHDEAIDYARSAVPEPASMLALGLGVAALLKRRVKK
jgi:hypothetical protein